MMLVVVVEMILMEMSMFEDMWMLLRWVVGSEVSAIVSVLEVPIEMLFPRR